MNREQLELQLQEVRNRMDYMSENYSGCDWCCGGGDDEMAELVEEEKRLLQLLAE